MFHPLSRVLPALAMTFLGFAAHAQGDLRATEIHNRPVVDATGQPVGAIRGFEFDTTTGQLSSVLVALGGAKDQAARLPLPSPLDLTKAQWSVKPTRKQLMSQPEPPPPPSGTRATSEMIGAEIKDPNGAPIGRIEDFVISPDGKVKLVIAEFIEAWYPEKGLVAVPLQSFDAGPPAPIAKFSPDHIRPAGSKPRAVASATPSKPAADVDLRVAQLIGRAVEDAAGKPVGKLEDLVIDAASKRVTALVVAGPGGRTALPLPLNVARLDERAIVLDPVPAGAPPAADAILATRLLQARLRSPKGDAVGTLRDVVVNLASGSLRYAVASFDTSWVGAGMVVAMAIPPVKRSGDGLDLPVDRDVLQTGMMIEEAHWKAATAEQYREYANKYIKGL